MILITGAGGKTGRAVARSLSVMESVCAFVHRMEQFPALETLGAEKLIAGDLRDERAVRSALRGIRGVYHICPNMSPDEVVIGKLVIEAAREAGVDHVVYHSVLHPQTERMPHHWQKLRVEEMLFESGLPFTILQPAPYMQNLRAGWKEIAEHGVLRVPYSVESRFSFVDLEDVAEAIRKVFSESEHRNAIYELVGTGPLSHVEVAEIMGHVLGRAVHAEKEDINEWRSRRATMSDDAVGGLVRMFEYYNRWGLSGNPNVLKWILRREPTSLESFLEKTVGEDQAAS